MVAERDDGWKSVLAYTLGMVAQAGIFYLVLYWWLGLPLILVSKAFLVLTVLTTAFGWSLFHVQKMSGLRRRWRWTMLLLWCLGVVGGGIIFWWGATWTWDTLPTNLLILAITAMLCSVVVWLVYRNLVNAKMGVRPDDADLPDSR